MQTKQIITKNNKKNIEDLDFSQRRESFFYTCERVQRSCHKKNASLKPGKLHKDFAWKVNQILISKWQICNKKSKEGRASFRPHPSDSTAIEKSSYWPIKTFLKFGWHISGWHLCKKHDTRISRRPFLLWMHLLW